MDFVCAGRSFHVTGGSVGAPHLWFVLTDPDPKTHKVIIVMVVTVRGHTDKTVTLQAGEHPFIKHDSQLDYANAKPMPANAILGNIKSGRWRPQPDMSRDLLDRVRRGLLESPRTPNFIVEYCKALFGGG